MCPVLLLLSYGVTWREKSEDGPERNGWSLLAHVHTHYKCDASSYTEVVDQIHKNIAFCPVCGRSLLNRPAPPPSQMPANQLMS